MFCEAPKFLFQLIHVLKCDRLISYSFHENSELHEIIKIFGKPPREIYGDCKDLPLLLKFTETTETALEKSKLESELEIKLKNVLEEQINKYSISRQISEPERKQLGDFLFHMLQLQPSKRMNAEELLAHPWLESLN